MTDLAKSTQNAGALQNTASNNAASPAERFQSAVLKNFADNSGDIKITNFQKKLVQSYFIKMDSVLKANEQKRLAAKYPTPVPFIWQNVNMDKLSQDVIAYSSIGLDPLQKNHVNLICYLNKTTQKFDVGFLIGYIGLELKAKKYGYDVPDDVTIQVVYKNDTFKPIKKDINNKVESYEFVINDAFNRGEIVGGFYYHEYNDNTRKNKLVVYNMDAINKRRPDKASAEFWGGEVDEWADGKKTGKKILVEGWLDEMVYKTMARAAYDAIAIDSEKIDEHLVHVMQLEETQPENGGDQTSNNVSNAVKSEVSNDGNKGESLNFTDAEVINEENENTSAEPVQNDTAKEEKHPEAEKSDTLRSVAEQREQAENALIPDIPDSISLNKPEPTEKVADAGITMSFGNPDGGLFNSEK